MKIGSEYSSERVLAKDFEQMAREAGLAPPMVRRRVPQLAETIIAALSKVETAHEVGEKVGALIRQRAERVLNTFKN